ncbi:Dehydrogenase (flavoprotein)-like protein [Pirellula staleyi DSM 6068]|uniref:Dehydrogenase (Flavoprotein)-like protein n=1 Tax=Pirellula staleyi (strain ATCC 27377 / DSM 6068 / ICPB 4128) TaxID=530564 RepID=D2R188_PIRSD|nr:FAD-dependent monooxygenase [Pirellula staleyi]ADB14873.1 Dehydrogenase (flavoprotein)-like protein [Pirellula staleyi DSM 6068]
MLFDCLILGAGPAGLALAARLSATGARVLVVDRDSADRGARNIHLSPLASQPVLPTVWKQLEALGLAAELRPQVALGAPAGVQIVTCSGQTVAQVACVDQQHFDDDHALPPLAWVSRQSLEQALTKLAIARGTTILRSTSVLDLSLDPSSSPRVLLAEDHAEPRWLEVPLVVDASGQQAIVGHHLRLIDPAGGGSHSALVGLYENASLASSATSFRTLFLPQHLRSRLWLAPQPGGMATVGIVGPRATLLRDRSSFAELLEDELVECPALAHCLLSAKMVGPLSVVRATGHKLLRGGGEGWLAVGDAFETLDPLPGWGVVTALESAAYAAPAILEAIASRTSSAELLTRWQRAFQAQLAPRKLLLLALASPGFGVADFLRQFPEHEPILAQLLVAGAVPADSSFEEDLAAQLVQLRPTAG